MSKKLRKMHDFDVRMFVVVRVSVEGMAPKRAERYARSELLKEAGVQSVVVDEAIWAGEYDCNAP